MTQPDILDLIDGAIEDYLSNDAMRWTPEPPKVLAPAIPIIDLQVVRQAVENLTANTQTFCENIARVLGPALQAMADKIGPIGPLLIAAESEQPPEDLMQRALWLRQHRNTGPASRQRAPKRIEARRRR